MLLTRGLLIPWATRWSFSSSQNIFSIHFLLVLLTQLPQLCSSLLTSAGPHKYMLWPTDIVFLVLGLSSEVDSDFKDT